MPNFEHIQGQGSVAIGGTTLYQPTAGMLGTVAQIAFNNTTGNPYEISLFIHRGSLASTVLAYKFSLAAGDVLNDYGLYHLEDSDYLYATTNHADTVFVISGSQMIGSPP